MITIKSKSVHVAMTDSLQEAIESHFSTILDNFESYVVEDIIVTLIDHSSQSTNKAEVKVHVPITGNDVHLTHKGEDMYKTIEEASKIVLKQMRKNKERFNKKGADSIRHPEPEVDTGEDDSDIED
jgi:ribosomal subunit interface protein